MQEVAITSSNMQETHTENMSQVFPEKYQLLEVYIELKGLTITDSTKIYCCMCHFIFRNLC